MGNIRLTATLASLTPEVIGYRDELPYVEPEKVAGEAVAHFESGGAHLILCMKVVLLLLNMFALIRHGKLLKNMDREKHERFFQKFANSRIMAFRGLVTILNTPIAMYYYTQDDVLRSLGYDRKALCEDADKHQVTR